MLFFINNTFISNTCFYMISVSVMKGLTGNSNNLKFQMKDVLSKQHCLYKIHTLLI